MGIKLSRVSKPKGEKAPEGFKWCPKCKAWTPIEMFYSNNTGRPDGLSSHCRTHALEYMMIQTHKNQRKNQLKKVQKAMQQYNTPDAPETSPEAS